MFDIGWSEMLIIAVLAIVVIGPKQLPQALRAFGYWVGKIRGMARDFQNQIDDVVRETELNEVKQDIQSISNMDINDFGDPSGTKDGSFKNPAYIDDNLAKVEENSATAASEHVEADDGISFQPPDFNDITEAAPAKVEAARAEVSATNPSDLDEPKTARQDA